MKQIIKTLSILLVAALLTSCSHWSASTKRLTTMGVSALVCGAAANQIAKGKGDPEASFWASASLCGAGGAVAGEYLFKDKAAKELETARREIAELNKMDRNAGRYLIDIDKTLRKGPDRIKCPGNNRDFIPLCTDKEGNLTDCKEPGFIYLDSKWAVQFTAIYSDGSCYPPPYDNRQDLKRYFKQLEKKLAKKKEKKK